MADVKRRYHAPTRAAAADETRRAVVAAAAELFVAQGYVATTVAQIADRAGVSRPTVFAVGSKPDLLARARDLVIAGDAEPVAISARPQWRQLMADPDPRALLRGYAAASAEINRRYAPLHEVLRRSAAAAPELGELYRRSESERLAGSRLVVDAVAQRAALTSTADIAADAVWVLTAPDTYYRLVHDRSWSHRRLVDWLGAAFVAALLGA